MNLDDILVNPYALDFEQLSIDEQSKLIEELLNKDIKELNTVVLSLFIIIFLFLLHIL